MKKFLSIFIALSLIVSLGTFVGSAETTSGKVFDLFIDSFDGNTSTLKDTTENVSSFSGVMPQKGSIAANSYTTHYLNFEPSEENIPFVKLGAFASPIMPNDALTVSAWINVSDITSGYRNLFIITPDSQPNAYTATSCSLRAMIYDGGLCLRQGNTDAFDTKLDLNEYKDKWINLTIVKKYDGTSDKTDLAIYVNGIGKRAVTKDGKFMTDGDNVYIGGCGFPESEAFKGKIAKFEIYNTNLTNDEIARSYVDNLEKFETEPCVFSLNADNYDGQNANTLLDRKGNIPSDYFLASVVPGVGKFDGINGEVSYLDYSGTPRQGIMIGGTYKSYKLINKKHLTISMWAKPTQVSSEYQSLFVITSNYGNSPQRNSLRAQILGGKVRLCSDWGEAVTSGASISDCAGKWTLFTFTREYDDINETCTFNVYVNGEKRDTRTLNADNCNNIVFYDTNNGMDVQFCIGGTGVTTYSGDIFNGQIATTDIYSKVLSDEEILGLYNSENKNFRKADVFSLDISNYDGNNANTLSDKAGTVPSSGFWATVLPSVDNYISLSGKTVKYLKYTNVPKQGIMTGGATSKEVVDNESMTISAWAKIKDTGSRYENLFMFTRNGTESSSLRAMIYGNKLQLRTDNSTQLSNDVMVSDYIGKWTLYTFSRDYDSENQKITYKIYINGELKSQNELEALTSPVKDAQSAQLCIGGSTWDTEDGVQTFSGDMASFDIYRTVETDEEISGGYLTQKNDFEPSYEITVSNHYFVNENEDDIDCIGANENIYFGAVINKEQGAPERRFSVYGVVYDKNGKIKSVVIDNKTILQTQKATTVSLSFENLAPTVGDNIRIFIWDNDNGGMKPILAEPYYLPYASGD